MGSSYRGFELSGLYCINIIHCLYIVSYGTMEGFHWLMRIHGLCMGKLLLRFMQSIF